jgi:hypothetical protein
VEILAATVKTPPPPENLRDLRPRPAAGMSVLLLAATVLVAALVAGWIFLGDQAPDDPVQFSGVVVEHLRIHGREVPTRVVAMPDVGAVVVMTAERHFGAIYEEREETAVTVIARMPETLDMERTK